MQSEARTTPLNSPLLPRPRGVTGIASLILLGGLFSSGMGIVASSVAQIILGIVLLILGAMLLRGHGTARFAARVLLLFAIWLRAVALTVAAYGLLISPQRNGGGYYQAAHVLVLALTGAGYVWCFLYLVRPKVLLYFRATQQTAANERRLVWASSVLLLGGLAWTLCQRYSNPLALPSALDSNSRGTPLPSIRTQ